MRGAGQEVIDAVLHREKEPYGGFSLRPISPVIGAEVGGVDLRGELTRQQAAELRRAFLEHHVLVFRDHAVSAAQQARIAAMLGLPLEPGRRRVSLPSDQLAHQSPSGAMAGTWRTDQTYRSTPPAGGVLLVESMSGQDAGWDMLFANMHLAYDLLSPQLKLLLGDLTAAHALEPAMGTFADASAEHPVVIRHPATGRPALFVSRAHTSHIVQLEPEHSEMTLGMLFRRLEASPVLTCRIRLEPDTLVLWDSRATQHVTQPDHGPGRLVGHLVSLAGARPERWDG